MSLVIKMFGLLCNKMIALIQRVKEAKVTINKKPYSKINDGTLVFLGIHKDDKKRDAEFLVNKLSLLRIFKDENNKMNKNIKEARGSMLIVSQFTLYSDIKRGNRPSFLNAAPPVLAKKLYDYFVDLLKINHDDVKTGKFGADMKVQLINDGPVTLILESEK